MLKSKKLLLAFAILSTVCVSIKGQDMNPSNNGNTPYSRYGLGTLSETSMVRNKGMGGIGIGLYSNLQTNPLNPASYTAIDTLTFIFDIGLNGQMSRFSEGGASQTDWSGGLEYMVMQFPIGKYVAASAGLLPYSYVGYKYGGVDSIPNTADDTNIGVTRQYLGNGGLNKAYLGFAVQPIKYLSVGVNAAYIFGNLSNDWNVRFSNSSGTTTYSYQTVSARALELQFGLQYHQSFNQKNKLTVGATFQPKMNMWTDMTQIETLVESDTVSSKHTINIPETYGLGFTYVYDNRLTIGADYKLEKWGDVLGFDDQLNISGDVYKNRSSIAVGAEYLPSFYGNYFKRMRYRVGFNYSDSYIDVKNSRNKQYGATIGLGFPLKGQKSMVNFSLEYAKVKPQNKAFISENYLQFNVGLIFNEMWFFKNKLQ